MFLRIFYAFPNLLNMKAVAIPDIMCHIPHHAVITSMPPWGGKLPNISGLNNSMSPSPEFCIPVSIVSVLLSFMPVRNNVPHPYPISKASRLCTRTIRNMYFMHFSNASKFCPRAMMTMAAKNSMDRYCIGFLMIFVSFGRNRAQSTPRTRGMPSSMIIVSNISMNGIRSCGRVPCMFASLRYSPPHMAKFAGVVKMHSAVFMAVSETDSSTLAFESEDMKLEMFSPGHAATSIIPSAIMGDIMSPMIIVIQNVSIGSSIIWHRIPVIADFGFLAMLMNVPGFMPSATPNITNASTIFRVCIPAGLMNTDILSISAASSGCI